MLKSLLFANALRLRHGIDYGVFPDEEEDMLAKQIYIRSWIKLIDIYTSLNLNTYNMKDMVTKFLNKEITFNLEPLNVNLIQDSIEIFDVPELKFQRYMREYAAWRDGRYGILKDNIVYKDAYLLLQTDNNKVVAAEAFLINGDSALRLCGGNAKNKNLIYYGTVAGKMCSESLNLDYYEIWPKSIEDYFKFTCADDRIKAGEEIKDYTSWSQDNIKKWNVDKYVTTEDLGDYIKYSNWKAWHASMSYDDIKEMLFRSD